ncbi:urease accessory protein UreF [Cognatishimia sp. MH4019]|uniref:urease accessory protein UreF n=1 Tax=Cognatishimia sp. MH4019 TaxID=2854030 RepID=UPI001CD3D0CA|nr:urease accessory UreF family protein [Cognatishimia sp. MH4019]
MSTDLLTLTQWLSPAFPLGSFAYSHGLEQTMAQGRVQSAAELQIWLEETLRFGAGWMDAVLLCQAMAGADVADMARALAASKERWEETFAQGTAFAETLKSMGHSVRPAALPVAVGEAARMLSLAPADVAQLYLHAFASNLVSVSVRFVPLGQSEGQAVLAALHPVIAEVAQRATDTPLDVIGAGVLMGDIAAMAHETLDVRLFRT